jgi:hypothetical protein
MQLRFFVIDIDEKWNPTLKYYKEQFEATAANGTRPEELGSLNLGSFTFTPTKAARHSENPRSWRIDCTGASKGKTGGSKHDKMVLEFTTVEGERSFIFMVVLVSSPATCVNDRQLKQNSRLPQMASCFQRVQDWSAQSC